MRRISRYGWLVLAFAVAAFGAGLAMAAPEALTNAASAATTAAPQPALSKEMGFWELMKAGGWLMYVLGGMSILALAFIIYFAIVLRQENVVPRNLLVDLRDLVGGGRMDEARAISERDKSAMAAVAGKALSYLQRTEKADPALLKDIVEGEGGRQAAMIQNQTNYLLDIAVIAPMVGLLGTVFGMLDAFNAVALDIAKARPIVLAGGVAKALITTAAGLLIGIPAMGFYAYFRNRVAKLVSMMESVSAELITQILIRQGQPPPPVEKGGTAADRRTMY